MKRMTAIQIFLATTILISCITPSAWADPIVLVTGEWSPYASEKIETKGLCPEILSAVAKEMGREVVFQFYPWKRCEHMVKKGKAWGAFPYMVNQERLKIYAFSDEIILSRNVFFVYGDSLKAIQWEQFSDLKPYKLGGVLGYGNHENMEKEGLKVEYAPKELMNFKKLKAGRVDLFSLDEVVGRQMIQSNFQDEINKFHVLGKAESEVSLCVMIDKTNSKSMALLEKFNVALKSIKSNGTYADILSKYHITVPQN